MLKSGEVIDLTVYFFKGILHIFDFISDIIFIIN